MAEILAESRRCEISDITADKVMDLIDDYSDINSAIQKTFECLNESFGKNVVAVATEQPSEVDQENVPEAAQGVLQETAI